MSLDQDITAAVLSFWFERDIVPGLCEVRPIWFDRVDPAFDDELRNRFLAVYERAAQGVYDGDVDSAEDALALTVVLDQFPRNMFRGTPRQYASDGKALDLAHIALDRGYDGELPAIRRWFLYMPFQHSERLADQDRAVTLFRSLGPEPVHRQVIASAELHRDIVRRFGRFPHRNRVLNRACSPEERHFLATFSHHHLGGP